MLALMLDSVREKTLSILCVGAHCDDIEIGCGGTLLALQGRSKRLAIDWAVLSGSAERRKEAQSSMRMLVKPVHRGELLFADFTDGRFPAAYSDIKEFVESLKGRLRPDLIFCHERDDRHQDHRVVNEMIWNSFRDHLVLEYEIPKWDGGVGQPNVYVPLGAKQAGTKVDALLKAHRSQAGRDWFTRDTFMAILRLRGLECRSPSGYAEAFHGRKLQFNAL
jgi:LmbE family N-acetylglucosaminyl deacetylase